MRRSFGGSGGGGMGGGGGGSSGMLRTLQRAVRAGVGGTAHDPFSHSSTTTAAGNSSTTNRRTYKQTTSNIISLSSSSTVSSPFSSSSSNNLPVSATWNSCSSPVCSDDFDWECVDGPLDDERAVAVADDYVFGSVPSKDEVQFAVSSLQQYVDGASFSHFVKDRHAYNSDGVATDNDTDLTHLVHRVSSSVGSESDWIEPSLQLCGNPFISQPYGSGRVFDAFHLLQSEPSVQKMVISLSSDKAVWNAVLNNEVVQELRESLNTAEKCASESTDKGSDDSDATGNVLSWIFDNTKAKVMEVFEKITKLVNQLFQPAAADGEKTSSGSGEATGTTFEEKLRTSFLLSVVVLLIVVVTRSQQRA